jgi:hypothetical protein
MNNNIFEYINGYEGRYKINRNGDIYSCKSDAIKSQMSKDDGYMYVHLHRREVVGTSITKLKNKEEVTKDIVKLVRHKYYVHRLVALQFIDNPDNLPEVDHIDRNKKNNSIENLRWVSRLTNARNKSNYKDNLSPEQLEARKDRTRERARLWAQKNRSEKGCKTREEMTKTEDPDYKANWAREMRATETEEHRAERRRKRREAYSKKEQSEEQKEKARERARKQRENKKQNLT